MTVTRDLDYLRLLAQHYPSIQATSTQIIELTAQLDLPKGTEHFLSDIHGEYEAFQHVLRNASGSIKHRVEELFANTLPESERQALAALIYYPEEKLAMATRAGENTREWQRITLVRLLDLCRQFAVKYTHEQVRAALPDLFATLIDELLYQDTRTPSKQVYYQSILESIIATNSGDDFIIALARLIQRLAVTKLHIIGDIYDRGAGAHLIMDRLLAHHDVDIQWGNHDIVWMGAAAGSAACIANVIRISLRYANMETLENGYAISMLPLASFALDAYGDDPCARFQPKVSPGDEFTVNELQLMARMQKAITIIQFKLEGRIIQRRPHYAMADRLLLERIDHEHGVITLGDTVYPLRDSRFPTVDAKDPYALTPGEEAVMERLTFSFRNSEKLQQHVRFLFAKGSMYTVANGNLLYHGCIPMRADGAFATMQVGAQELSAREYMDHLDRVARQGYFATDAELKQYGQDVMWYMWTGGASPLFGKSKMATFERAFIADKATHIEKQNPYYDLRDAPTTPRKILTAFGLAAEESTIINGHVPVEVKAGESPVKADGRLIVIDGGFAKAYQAKTGIAGYTLIYNSWGLLLAAHDPFESRQRAIEDAVDIETNTQILQQNYKQIRIRDTDEGKVIQRRIEELQALLDAYRSGLLKEDA